MWTVEAIAPLRARIAEERAAGKRVALVPTMGALHDGHLSLVQRARAAADVVAVSVFVNSLQFGPGEDLARYPRDPLGDAASLRHAGADILFLPTNETMYEGTPEIRVDPGPLGSVWEGKIRPGHFAGVLTVVAKLFNIVQPDVAVFGRKDFQQAALVRGMIDTLNFPVELLIAPIVREADGLARSSRNVFLGAEDRIRARAIPAALSAIVGEWSRGERDSAVLAKVGTRIIAAAMLELDYLALVNPRSLAPAAHSDAGTVVIVAARAGATRLLDNTVLGEAESDPLDRVGGQ